MSSNPHSVGRSDAEGKTKSEPGVKSMVRCVYVCVLLYLVCGRESHILERVGAVLSVCLPVCSPSGCLDCRGARAFQTRSLRRKSYLLSCV